MELNIATSLKFNQNSTLLPNYYYAHPTVMTIEFLNQQSMRYLVKCLQKLVKVEIKAIYFLKAFF